MEFRNLKKQYIYLKDEIDKKMSEVIDSASFIGGEMIDVLEHDLSSYVNIRHCITCANGTDALQIALLVWNIGKGDAVFVPDFTFFSSGEVVAAVGATPIFVDVRSDTFNVNPVSLEEQIRRILDEGKLIPKVIVSVDLFGQPAEYDEIRKIADKYKLFILEDGAQGYGGRINDVKACAFGDISTTSFFPAKPLGCYGDGGAIFTDNDEWAEVIRSIKVHGKGKSKYDNVRIGMNSRLDAIQAAVLVAKLPIFMTEELLKEQEIAVKYTYNLKDIVKTPSVLKGYYSSWAQYTIQLPNRHIRDGLQQYLRNKNIPSMIYYQKPMHRQTAFESVGYVYNDEMFTVAETLCDTVLSLPFDPYKDDEEIGLICDEIKRYMGGI